METIPHQAGRGDLGGRPAGPLILPPAGLVRDGPHLGPSKSNKNGPGLNAYTKELASEE